MEIDELKTLQQQLLPLVTDTGYKYIIDRYKAKLKEVEKEILTYTKHSMHKFDRLQGKREILVWIISLLQKEIDDVAETIKRDKDRNEEVDED